MLLLAVKISKKVYGVRTTTKQYCVATVLRHLEAVQVFGLLLQQPLLQHGQQHLARLLV
jgi:hypothetical protein